MKMQILITVKTYPTFSEKYEELVCTAGFDQSGNWVRLYPIPFRKLDYASKYSKYDWIELDVIRNSEDPRSETFRPTNIENIRVLRNVGTQDGKWTERKRIVLKKVWASLSDLIAEAKDKNKCTSLAVFKPTKILDFYWEEESEKEWDPEKLAILHQQNIFEPKGSGFQVVRKLPYKFYYRFTSANGTEHNLMIEDWEVGALYWKGMEKHQDEAKACQYVRAKFFDELVSQTDLHFFLGTTKLWHFRAPNPFVIIGTFHPRIDHQTSLLLE